MNSKTVASVASSFLLSTVLAGTIALPAAAKETNAGVTVTSLNSSLAPTAEPRLVTVKGRGPVIQILPGPAQFADSAAPIIAKMPAEKQQMMTMMGQNGPFSDRVAKISGTFSGNFRDAGSRGDSVAATASFRTQDGARWQVKLNRVAPEDGSPLEPHWGGVATEIGYHGATGLHAPLVPNAAPTHVMFTSDTRGDDFAHQCWICTDQPVRQLHLMLMPPEGKPYEVPGGILHMWEDSKYQISNPARSPPTGRGRPSRRLTAPANLFLVRS